jgi:hypothetical protein
MIAPKRKRLYFKYTGKIIFDSNSYNVIGRDLLPRYRIVPEILKEILVWSPRSESTSLGYTLDQETGLYLKNLNISNETALIEFLTIKLKPPFGYHNSKTYSEFVYRTFNDEYQSILKNYFDVSEKSKVAVGDGTEYIEDSFTYFYTLVTKKFKDENKKSFVRYSFD